MEHLVKLLDENVASLKRALDDLRDQRERVGRSQGFKSDQVADVENRISSIKSQLKNIMGRGYHEDIDMDGEDEFDFDLDDREDDVDFDDEDDGQPSDYEEWQDFMGGDDWDHGQYDEDSGEDVDFDDEDSMDYDDEDKEELDFNDDGDIDDHEEDHGDTDQRLDDLEDKLNTLLSKFSEVLAQDIIDEPDDENDGVEGDEEFGDGENNDEFDADELNADDLEDEEDVEEDLTGYGDHLPSNHNVDDYDYEVDKDYKLDYQGNVRSRDMEQRRRRRWKEFRTDEKNSKR